MIRLVSVLLCGFLFFSFSASDWELRKDEEGIKVYTRSVAGTALDEFKGEGTFDVSINDVIAVLKDADRMKDWSPNCEYSELLSLRGDEQIHYTISGAPFPLDDRDSYVRFIYKKEGDKVRVEMEALPNYKPREEGMVRISELKGYWLLEPLSPQRTKVTYQLLADPGGSVPDWLANSASVDTPFNTIKGLRDYLKNQ